MSRQLLSGVTMFFGGYVLLLALTTGTLSLILSGRDMGLPVGEDALIVGQTVFATLVVIAGALAAPSHIGARVIASGIFLAVLILHVVFIALSWSSPAFSGLATGNTVGNSYFMVALAVGSAWLIANRARYGWFALISVVLLVVVAFLRVNIDIPPGMLRLIMFVTSLLVGVTVLVAGLRRTRQGGAASGAH